MFKKMIYSKVVKKWNNDAERRIEYFNKSIDEERSFKWSHLVWQEINAWIRNGKQVDEKEFKWIVERRGFDYNMASYLLELVRYSGLGKKLKEIELLDRVRVIIKEEPIEKNIHLIKHKRFLNNVFDVVITKCKYIKPSKGDKFHSECVTCKN